MPTENPDRVGIRENLSRLLIGFAAGCVAFAACLLLLDIGASVVQEPDDMYGRVVIWGLSTRTAFILADLAAAAAAGVIVLLLSRRHIRILDSWWTVAILTLAVAAGAFGCVARAIYLLGFKWPWMCF